jgi:ketosteroid isomerase-like protein
VVRLPYAPDPVPKVTRGKGNVVGLYGGFPSLVSPLGFHDLEITALPGDGQLLATYRSDATMLATGQPYRNDYISLFTVRDGRLAAFTEYFDPLVFVTAAGATVQAPG